MPNLQDSEEGRAMLRRVDQQIRFLQSRKPQHVVHRYGALPVFPVKLVLPTVPEEHECNDCGIMIPSWRPICTLCEKWYEERGMELPK